MEGREKKLQFENEHGQIWNSAAEQQALSLCNLENWWQRSIRVAWRGLQLVQHCSYMLHAWADALPHRDLSSAAAQTLAARPNVRPKDGAVAAVTDGGQFADRRRAERRWFTATPLRGNDFRDSRAAQQRGQAPGRRWRVGELRIHVNNRRRLPEEQTRQSLACLYSNVLSWATVQFNFSKVWQKKFNYFSIWKHFLFCLLSKSSPIVFSLN